MNSTDSTGLCGQQTLPVLGAVANPAKPIRLTRPTFRLRARQTVLLLLLCLPLACILGVASYFYLSADAKALRGGVMSAVPGDWEKQFAVNVGGLTLSLVHAGSGFVNLPPEARAALDAVHGAEVGVYKLLNGPQSIDRLAVLKAADREMAFRGWERIVGVAEPEQLVAIYLPRKGFSHGRVKCCLAVLEDRELVVVSARVNLERLMQLAEKEVDRKHPFHLGKLLPTTRANGPNPL